MKINVRVYDPKSGNQKYILSEKSWRGTSSIDNLWNLFRCNSGVTKIEIHFNKPGKITAIREKK